jgi:DNA-binding NarL/FixJ family response regulator
MTAPFPVLFVGDDDASAARLGRLLLAHGLRPDLLDPASGVQATIDRMLQRCYRLALVDMRLPDGDGAEVIRCLLAFQPDRLKCIVSGGVPVSPAIARMLLAWVSGGDPVRMTAAHDAASMEAESPPAAPQIVLTPREQDVLSMISQGCTNKEAARRLGVSVHTVDYHAKNAYAKLSARSRTQAVTRARDRGLIS